MEFTPFVAVLALALFLLLSLLLALLHPRWPIRLLSVLALTCDGVVFYRAGEKKKRVALTIDDAPHHKLTPHLLDKLKKHNCRATFFCIGSQVASGTSDEILRRMVDEGHELGNHMMHDQPTIRLPLQQFESELISVEKMLHPFQPMSGRPFKWFRPGSGWYNKGMVEIAKENGYTVVLGDCYPFDVLIRNATIISAYIKWMVRPGSIIIVHDGLEKRRFTIDVLESVLPYLKKNGFEVVSLSELMTP